MMEVLPKIASFSSDVRKLIEEKQMEYIDAVVHWCELNEVEVEYAADMIKKDPAMLFSVQVEAENLNYLKKMSRLPV
jgi:1,4-dihydroxy-2-naphthoyl-CoA synthase